VLQFAALISGSFEVWFVLRIFGHPVSAAAALVLESMTQAVRHLAFVVPAGVGVQEAGLVLFGQALGIGSELALAVSMAKRIREVLCGLPSLMSWQWMEGRRLRGAGCRMPTSASVIRLPRSLQHRLEAATSAFMNLQRGRIIDFTRPLGEEALLPPDSVSWRVCKNPLALFIGGVAAVILELAEPAVRAGVWEHSSFRKNPVGRLQRTGLAAMATVYGARSVSEPMIAGVVRMHQPDHG
jgi:hypothetical protein